MGMRTKKIKPKCQIKWDEIYENELKWKLIWNNIQKLTISRKIKEFQWKCVHRIIYTEHRLNIMNMSNGKCHFCEDDNVETLQHLFYQCNTTQVLIAELFRIFVQNG